MADSRHKATLEVHVDDAKAQAAADALLAKLQAAQRAAAGTGVGVVPTGGGGGGGGGPGVASATAAQRAIDRRAATIGSRLGQIPGLLGGRLAALANGDPTSGLDLVTRGGLHLGSAAGRQLGKQIAADGAEGVGALRSALGDPRAIAAMAAAAVVVGAGVAGVVGTKMRYQMAGQIADLERGQILGRFAGGANLGLTSGRLRDAAALGFDPAEAVGTLSQFYQQIGIAGAGRARDPFRAMLAGVGAGAQGAYLQSSTERDFAEATQSLPRALGLAINQQGMRGSNVEAMLSQIAQASNAMLSQGMRLDRLATINLASQLAGTGQAFGGLRATEGALKFSQIGQNAAHSFAGNFAGLSDAALMAEAAAGASNPLDMLGRLEGMAGDPRQVRAAMIRRLGPAGAALGMVGSGFSSSQARAAAGALPGARAETFEGLAGADVRMGAARARGQLGQLAEAEGSKEALAQMVEGLAKLSEIMMRFSTNFDAFTTAMLPGR